MKHKKCGGKFVKESTENNRVIYQCNKCYKVMTVYHKTATSGSPKRGEDDR